MKIGVKRDFIAFVGWRLCLVVHLVGDEICHRIDHSKYR